MALLKISPVLLLAGMMMISNLDVGLFQLDILVIAPIATMYAAIIAYITEKLKFQELVDAAVDNAFSGGLNRLINGVGSIASLASVGEGLG